VANNQVYQEGRYLYLTVGVGVVSGDPVLVGGITGVAVYSADASNKAVVDCGGVYDLSVKAINDSGASAVAVGDAIFYVAADTPKLSKKASGYFFGYALEAVDASATATINVKCLDAPNVGALDIADGSITHPKLAADAVETDNLKALNVTHVKLADDAVEAHNVKDGEITHPKLAANAAETDNIKDANVTHAKLADDAVEGHNVKDGEITHAKLAADAAETDNIKALNVTHAKLADDAVEGHNVKDGEITHSKLAADAAETDNIKALNVTHAKLADDAVEGHNVKDGEISHSKLAADAAETDNIKDLNVTTGKLADTAVTTIKLGAAAVTPSKLGLSDLAMVLAETRLITMSVVPTVTSLLNKEFLYVRSDIDTTYDEGVAGEDGWTTAMFRTYVGASQGGVIIESLRAGVNLGNGVIVSDGAGAGYIAGGRITTYVPATANAKTNYGLIVAPRDNSAEVAIAGSIYCGFQAYLMQVIGKDESRGIDVYTEPGSADIMYGIQIRNGAIEKYGIGIDMSAANIDTAELKLSNNATIDNLAAGIVDIAASVRTGGIVIDDDPVGVAATVAIGNTAGVGDAAPANIQAPAIGTGGGPTNSALVVNWVKTFVGVDARWIPVCA